MPAAIPPFKRLVSGYLVDEKTECWNWQGHKYSNGYGCLKVFGRTISAHRFSYELHKGPIPEGLSILHSCDNRRCINPDHMKVGTHAENMREAAERGRMPSGKKHHMSINGNPRKGIKSRQSKQVRVLGKSYPSQNIAEKELCLGHGTIRYWIRTKSPKAQYITKEEYLRDA